MREKQIAKLDISRHFPALAQNGTQVIVVEKETKKKVNPPRQSTLHSKSVYEEAIEGVPTLTAFRATVLCKHTKRRQSMEKMNIATEPKKVLVQTVPFKPTNASDAKSKLHSQVPMHDDGKYHYQPIPRRVKNNEPRWKATSAKDAKQLLRDKKMENTSSVVAVQADRAYTKRMIQQNRYKFYAN